MTVIGGRIGIEVNRPARGQTNLAVEAARAFPAVKCNSLAHGIVETLRRCRLHAVLRRNTPFQLSDRPRMRGWCGRRVHEGSKVRSPRLPVWRARVDRTAPGRHRAALTCRTGEGLKERPRPLRRPNAIWFVQ